MAVANCHGGMASVLCVTHGEPRHHQITGQTLIWLTGAGQSLFCSLAMMVSHVVRERWLQVFWILLIGFSFMIWCVFIEKSSRESVEAISGVAAFDRFYQDSGQKSACVYNVQSPRAA